MATHSSVLAWRISGTGESSGLPSVGSHRVGHDWSDLAAAAADRQSWIRPEVRTPIMEETGDNGDTLIVALGLERNREMVETKLGRFRGIGDWELCGAELHLLGAWRLLSEGMLYGSKIGFPLFRSTRKTTLVWFVLLLTIPRLPISRSKSMKSRENLLCWDFSWEIIRWPVNPLEDLPRDSSSF